jgi:hypothetical protein
VSRASNWPPARHTGSSWNAGATEGRVAYPPQLASLLVEECDWTGPAACSTSPAAHLFGDRLPDVDEQQPRLPADASDEGWLAEQRSTMVSSWR